MQKSLEAYLALIFQVAIIWGTLAVLVKSLFIIDHHRITFIVYGYIILRLFLHLLLLLFATKLSFQSGVCQSLLAFGYFCARLADRLLSLLGGRVLSCGLGCLLGLGLRSGLANFF